MKKNTKLTAALISTLLLASGAVYETAKTNKQTVPTQSYLKVIYMPSARYPETAAHVKDAESKGESSICTIDRKDVTAHRKESLKGIETKPGLDRDEFPPAMCLEGGKGADVRLISSSDNRGAGSWMSHQLAGLPDGTKVLIKVK